MGVLCDAVLAAAGLAKDGQRNVGFPKSIQHIQLADHAGVAGDDVVPHIILQFSADGQPAVHDIAILFNSDHGSPEHIGFLGSNIPGMHVGKQFFFVLDTQRQREGLDESHAGNQGGVEIEGVHREHEMIIG